MTNWIDMINSDEPLRQWNTEIANNPDLHPVAIDSYTYPSRFHNMMVKPGRIMPTTLFGHVGFISIVNTESAIHETTDHNYGYIQRISSMTMVFTKPFSWPLNNSSYPLNFDESVGIFAPPDAIEFNVSSDGRSGSFIAANVVPHRDDGFPAVISIIGLTRSASLNCSTTRAKFIGASWYQNGVPHRNNGPISIGIHDYYDYHGCVHPDRSKLPKFSGILTRWSSDPPTLDDVHGTTNAFSNRYFDDPQDELAWVTTHMS